MRKTLAVLAFGTSVALPFSAMAQTAPATKADPDAMCFIALGEVAVVATQHPEIVTDENKNEVGRIQQAFGFYTARVLDRFATEQLNDVIYVANRDYAKLDPEQKKQIWMDCYVAVRGELQKLLPALKAASERMKRGEK